MENKAQCDHSQTNNIASHSLVQYVHSLGKKEKDFKGRFANLLDHQQPHTLQ